MQHRARLRLKARWWTDTKQGTRYAGGRFIVAEIDRIVNGPVGERKHAGECRPVAVRALLALRPMIPKRYIWIAVGVVIVLLLLSVLLQSRLV